MIGSTVIDVGFHGVAERAGRARVKRRSIENPSVPLSQAVGDDWDDAWGILKSDAGVKISKRTALTISGMYRGVERISRDVAKIPVFVYRNLAGGGKEKDRAHPAHALVRRKINPHMTAFRVKQTLTMHKLLRGNGYGYIKRRGDMTPLEIWPLSPDETYPVRANGELFYVTRIPLATDDRGNVTQSELVKIPARDMIHVMGVSYDGLIGENVIRNAAHSLGLIVAHRRHGSKFYVQGVGGRIVLETPNILSPEAAERMRSGWERMTAGIDNAHRTAVLEEGTKANFLAVNAQEAQLVEMMKAGLVEVANWLGLPVHMVGGEGRTAYASLEQENQSYLDDALDGNFCAWESELNDKLLTEEEKENETHTIEFLRQALVRANMAQRYAAYRQGLDSGWLNRDEVRERENMNPLPDGQGKIYLTPMNMQPAGAENKTAEDAEGAEEKTEGDDRSNPAEVATALVGHVVSRMVRRLAAQAKKSSRSKEKCEAWRKTRLANHVDPIAVELEPVLKNWESWTKQRAPRAKIVAEWLCDRFLVPFDELDTSVELDELKRQVAQIANRQVTELPVIFVNWLCSKSGKEARWPL